MTMKTLQLALILTLTSAFSMNAFSETVLAEKQATSQSGRSIINHGPQAKSCTYSLVSDDRGLALYLNSDLESLVNFKGNLDKTSLPLHEGENETGYDNVRVVKVGSRIQIINKVPAPSYGFIIETLNLVASADLRNVKSANYTQEMTKIASKRELLEELACEF